MQIGTLQAVKALFSADPTIDQGEKKRLIALCQSTPNRPQPNPCVLRHAEVARRLGGVTKKTVNNLARSGLLTPVRLPGRVRALGFRESDVMALIEQRKV